MLPRGVAGSWLGERAGASSGTSCGRVHTTVGGSRNTSVAKSRGSVPVELTGDPAHTGKTLECGRTAKTVLEDSWDKKNETTRKKEEGVSGRNGEEGET